MSLKKSGVAWLVSVAFASTLTLTPAEARANETLDALPFMVFAAAFSTLIIVYAVNNPTDSSTNESGTSSGSDSTGDSTSSDALRSAHGPMRPAPILGFSGRF